MRYYVEGYDLHGRVRLRRDTLEGAIKKANELVELRFYDVSIEHPDGTTKLVSAGRAPRL